MEVRLGILSRPPERHVKSEPDLNICFTPEPNFLIPNFVWGCKIFSMSEKSKKCAKIKQKNFKKLVSGLPAVLLILFCGLGFGDRYCILLLAFVLKSLNGHGIPRLFVGHILRIPSDLLLQVGSGTKFFLIVGELYLMHYRF